MVAVGREAHPRSTENRGRIDPEGVAEIGISPNLSNRIECRPDRAFRSFPHGVSSDVCDPCGQRRSGFSDGKLHIFTLLLGGSDAVAAGEGCAHVPSPAPRGRLSRRESDIGKSATALPCGVESSFWISLPAVWLRHRRLPSVTAPRSVP